MIINKLSQTYVGYIKTPCTEGMTYESILLDAFDQLGQLHTETTRTSGIKFSPAFTVSYDDIKASLSLGEITNQKHTSTKQFIPPQLTARRLATLFGEAKFCWVLEDFHKIKGADKTRTSQLMKVFMDMSLDYPELKLIAIGAVGTARQVIEYDKEMNNRVAEISVPYMSNSEIISIITNGEEKLNLKFNQKAKYKIIKYSCGLPSICHQLCLNICLTKRIYSTNPEKHAIIINLEDLEEAVEKFLYEKSDTFKSEFDQAIKIGNNTQLNLPKEVLKTALEINKDEFSFDDIYNKLKGILRYKNTKLKAEDVEKILGELCSVKRSEILVHDDNSNKYRFNNLFLKAYTQLQFKEEQAEIKMLTDKNRRLVERLMEIIEHDVSDMDEYPMGDLLEDEY
ncbi:hypothetical protein SAMN05421545_3129 [Pontibacter lucknowensis]|uniref:Uncharacterized protein n=1 Tax=Pontibacter lucknowensis TaxID=1077936 RepID=A0A1N6ZZT4_9BACT|nr:hypothetical protein SAMN05421545_3129 [Pontibacter lucknowensis]